MQRSCGFSLNYKGLRKLIKIPSYLTLDQFIEVQILAGQPIFMLRCNLCATGKLYTGQSHSAKHITAYCVYPFLHTIFSVSTAFWLLYVISGGDRASWSVYGRSVTDLGQFDESYGEDCELVFNCCFTT